MSEVSFPRAPRTEPRSAMPFAGADRAGMPTDLLTAEQSAFRRFSPRRNRWQGVAAFDEQVAELEGEAQRLMSEMQAQHELLSQAKHQDRDRLADFVANGSQGATPDSEVAFREEKIKDLERRLEGVNHQIGRVLGEKAAYVEHNRGRLTKDAAKATAAAERRYAELIDEAERARQEAVELREAELWALTFPECRQGEEQIPRGMAGNLQAPLKKAGIDHALEPGTVFDVLRADAGWIPGAAKPELKEKLGQAEQDGAQWLDTPEGQSWQQQQQRATDERVERARTWGVRQPEWGDPQ